MVTVPRPSDLGHGLSLQFVPLQRSSCTVSSPAKVNQGCVNCYRHSVSTLSTPFQIHDRPASPPWQRSVLESPRSTPSHLLPLGVGIPGLNGLMVWVTIKPLAALSTLLPLLLDGENTTVGSLGPLVLQSQIPPVVDRKYWGKKKFQKAELEFAEGEQLCTYIVFTLY